MAKTAFLGLGVMGFPMAGHLAGAGHQVTVYNRSPAKAEAWTAQHGGASAPVPRAAAEGAEMVLACVGNDDDLRQVCLGPDGAFAGMRAGAVFVDHTTVSAEVTRELAEVAQAAGIAYVDAPVSGGEAGARNGQLSIMCGGAEADVARAAAVIGAYAKICRRMGPVGAGQMTKMCNQIAIAGLVQALSESLAFAQKAGLDVADVVEVISQGAASSWQMVNRHATMASGSFDHGFAVDWMRKDLAICLAAGDELGAALPVTALVDQFYKDIQVMGGGRWDTSSLIARLVR
ncbi:NAD(P)-dependent oxidoreductase [Paracoccus liaowanqingii]|uniref:NAD(P)-dependent oxidoreductase n=1 Tax=Paracoccus liaowanqingii TaxID=2560053 RepID=A0A4P7HPJ5_9RHOB|nr:NAD(P)-dependent oxidoreductase [Paracoccus liaowanqingii]QBX35317.1 NAD(P)-dependent oxidoreductase [Paracoccus liaowanqingii]